MKKNPLAIILATLLLGCNVNTSTIDKDSAQQKINDQWALFVKAWESEDAEGCAQFYFKDALNIPPNAPIKNGRKAVQDFYQFLFDNNLKSDYTHTVNSVDVGGDQIIELGEFQVDWVRNDSTSWTFNARSMTHWKKDESGNWLIQKFMYNNPPES